MLYLTSLLFASLMITEPKQECVRWTWTGDVYNRVVVCLEWRDKDAPKKIEKKKTT